MQSAELKDLAVALCAVQTKLKTVAKDSRNPHFNSKFASLEAVVLTAGEYLPEQGLCVVQVPETLADGGPGLRTMLLHKSGQWICGTQPLLITKNDPQGVASAMTYARRYGMMAILGLAPEDDDGNAASASAKPKIVAQTLAHPSANGDGFMSDHGYRIKFGKWVSRSLEEVYKNEGPQAIASYIDFLEGAAKKKGLPKPTGDAGEFIIHAEKFLGAMENGAPA